MSEVKRIGLDLGTNMLVAAFVGEEGLPIFKMQRDAFFTIVPKSDVNRNSIKTSLEKRAANFVVEEMNLIVVGQDALEIAIERNDVAKRPMQRGVLSPKEKQSFPILKLLIENLIGKGRKGDKVVFSVPAEPITDEFDVVYHTELFKTYLLEMGYSSVQSIGEAFAIALSELLDDNLTGITLSWGAGQINCAVVHQGDPLVMFSIPKAGDYIDESVGKALDISPSLVQLEKENNINLFEPRNKIEEAISVYYSTLITYILENMVYELNRRKKDLPLFRDPVPIVVSGGLTLAEGFTEKFEMCLNGLDFPIKISGVRRAKDPLKCVAHGCLLAAQL